jgi:hypothetical protein
LVKENLDARSREREDGVGEGGLTKSLSWSAYSTSPRGTATSPNTPSVVA